MASVADQKDGYTLWYIDKPKEFSAFYKLISANESPVVWQQAFHATDFPIQAWSTDTPSSRDWPGLASLEMDDLEYALRLAQEMWLLCECQCPASA